MDFRRLNEFLDSLLERGVPGWDMMIRQGGQTIYRRMNGFADREAGRRMQGDELYYVYSASKVVTAVAALTLYEQGKFLMTDPVSAYIPAFGNMKVKEIRPDDLEVLHPAVNPITMRDLFTMTSGLNYDLKHPAVLDVIHSTQGKAPTLAVAEAIAKRPLYFESGTRFMYGLSHDVLAAVVEVISGKRFSEYVREHIFEPCGMKDSCYHLDEEKKTRMARQYLFDDALGKAVPTDNSNEYVFGSEYDSGGAGMITSLEDYMRFAEMLTRRGVTEDGCRILSGRTVDLMRTNHLGPAPLKDFDWVQFKGYGYGLGVRTMLDRTACGSAGPVGEFGWSGAAGAWMLIDPENQLTAYYAQHMLNSQEPYTHPRLRNLIYACVDE